MSRRCYAFTLLSAILATPAFAAADAVEIKPGDHIASSAIPWPTDAA